MWGTGAVLSESLGLFPCQVGSLALGHTVLVHSPSSYTELFPKKSQRLETNTPHRVSPEVTETRPDLSESQDEHRLAWPTGTCPRLPRNKAIGRILGEGQGAPKECFFPKHVFFQGKQCKDYFHNPDIFVKMVNISLGIPQARPP